MPPRKHVRYLSLYWVCFRCHLEAFVDNAYVDERLSYFDVRCPHCDRLTRFVTPETPEGGIRRSDTIPPERH